LKDQKKYAGRVALNRSGRRGAHEKWEEAWRASKQKSRQERVRARDYVTGVPRQQFTPATSSRDVGRARAGDQLAGVREGQTTACATVAADPIDPS
jgi:hypothetical protein